MVFPIEVVMKVNGHIFRAKKQFDVTAKLLKLVPRQVHSSSLNDKSITANDHILYSSLFSFVILLF